MVESNTVYAPKTGLYTAGLTGEYISTPSSTLLDNATELGFIWSGILPNVGSSPLGRLFARFGTTGNYCFAAGLTSGTLSFLWSADGTNLISLNAPSSLSSISSDGEFISLGYTLTGDNGAGKAEVRFWYKYLGDSEYTLLDSVLHSTTSSIKINASALLIVNSLNTSSQPLEGTVYDFQMYSGIGDNSQPGLGTLVAEADFSYPWTNNKYRDKTGKIWTINGSAWAWEYQDDPSERYDSLDIIYGGDAHSLIPDTVGGATASSLPTHIYEGDVI